MIILKRSLYSLQQGPQAYPQQPATAYPPQPNPNRQNNDNNNGGIAGKVIGGTLGAAAGAGAGYALYNSGIVDNKVRKISSTWDLGKYGMEKVEQAMATPAKSGLKGLPGGANAVQTSRAEAAKRMQEIGNKAIKRGGIANKVAAGALGVAGLVGGLWAGNKFDKRNKS